jgi:superfamily II DNA or RNA helicase
MIKLRPHQQEANYAMLRNVIGQIIVPTGGGKTLIAIMDAMKRFEVNTPRTIVVVAPRLLLLPISCAVSIWNTSPMLMFACS